MAPTGGIPGRLGGRIYISLDDYERRTGLGYALLDNVGFVVDLPDRGSFSSDPAFHPGPSVPLYHSWQRHMFSVARGGP